MDVIIRKPRWDDADAFISNYYSLLDEAKEDPFFGITQPHQRPDLASEHRWFSDLYAAVLRWDAVAYVAEADGRVVGMYVVKGYRGKFEVIVLEVLTTNTVAKRLYQGKGFRPGACS